MNHEQMVGALEAVLFAAGEPITVGELANVLQLDKPLVWDLLATLEHDYEGENRGLMVRHVGEGYQLVTKPVHYRLLTNLGKTRPDMGRGCKEKIDLEFLVWVWNYNKKHQQRYYKLLNEAEHAETIVLKNRRMVKKFLNSL